MTAESHARATAKPLSAPLLPRQSIVTMTHSYTSSGPAATTHEGESNAVSLAEISSFLSISSSGGLIPSSPTDLSIPNHIKSKSMFKEFFKDQHYSVLLDETMALAHVFQV